MTLIRRNQDATKYPCLKRNKLLESAHNGPAAMRRFYSNLNKKVKKENKSSPPCTQEMGLSDFSRRQTRSCTLPAGVVSIIAGEGAVPTTDKDTIVGAGSVGDIVMCSCPSVGDIVMSSWSSAILFFCPTL